MTILNQPIATWISIAAFLISLSTLLLTRRKQRYDERLSLAKQIADIKIKYGEGLRVVRGIIADLGKFKEVAKGEVQNGDKNAKYFILKYQSNFAKIENSMKVVYDKLGYRATRTTDPVTLSAIAVDCEQLMKDIALIRSDIATIIHEFEEERLQK